MNSSFGPRVVEVTWARAEGISSLQMLRLLGEVLFSPSGAVATGGSAPPCEPIVENTRAAPAPG